MIEFTPEEKRAVLFICGMALCGLFLNSLIKANPHFKKMVYPQIELARIELNKADFNELSGLKCISASLAQRIIDYRTKHNGFISLDELKNVKGIGEKRFEKLKNIFFVE